jgi:hypothetical protein
MESSSNRPSTIAPTSETAYRIGEVVETKASLARTFTADEIEALVEELGWKKILELSVLIEELGRSRLIEIFQEEVALFNSEGLDNYGLRVALSPIS